MTTCYVQSIPRTIGYLTHIQKTFDPMTPCECRYGRVDWRLQGGVSGYESLLRSRVLPPLGTMPLNKVSPAVVDAWVADMIDDGLSPSRIRQSHQLLGAMMRLAVRRGLISSDPTDGTELPAAINREQRFLTAAELQAIAKGMPERLRAAVWTLGIAGLRFGEMAALKPADIDILRRRIAIRRSVTEVGGRLVSGCTKNRKTRSVAIPKALAEILAAHLATHERDTAFPNSKGGTLRVSNFRSHILKACEATGVESIRIHDLRHTAASLMLAVEPDLHLVMRQLGHSSISVTVDRYGHLMPDRAEQVADKLDALLKRELIGGTVTSVEFG
jgi:integrase